MSMYEVYILDWYDHPELQKLDKPLQVVDHLTGEHRDEFQLVGMTIVCRLAPLHWFKLIQDDPQLQKVVFGLCQMVPFLHNHLQPLKGVYRLVPLV